MMSSTIFNGLYQNGYEVDIVFGGTAEVISEFSKKYSKYFNKVYYTNIKELSIKRLFSKLPKGDIIYSYCLHFVYDQLFRGYDRSIFNEIVKNSVNYDLILSFIPPIISGKLAIDINKICFNNHVKLIQFWTDPLSLGRCDGIKDIPWYRCLHKRAERDLLKYADKAVFCYPLLCEMEQLLHPQYKHKMHWSDVGYMERKINFPQDNIRDVNNLTNYTVGLFGAYQYRVRNICPLLETIKKLPQVNFIIRGDSDVDIDAEVYNNLDLVKGRRPLSEIEQLEQGCDILLCLGGKSGITHPAGKVFYYANYKKPIVYIGDGQNNEYFKNYLSQFNRYIICDNTPDSIQKGILKAIGQLDNQATWEIPERLEPKVIARKLVEL